MNTGKKRIPETQHKDHEYHIAERGFNSMSQYNLAHKPFPVHQAMKIPDAKAAVVKACTSVARNKN